MLTERVRRFLPFHQSQLAPLLIALWAGGLSLHFTVRACRGLSPADSALEIGALGMLGEGAKLYFGPHALLGLVRSRGWLARLGYLALLALVLVLMAGSVGASFVFTTQTEAQRVLSAHAAHAEALATSPTYREVTADIGTYSRRIAELSELARSQRADDQRRLALMTDERLGAVQAEKNAALARRQALAAGAANHSAQEDGSMMPWVHLAVAIVLELVGVAACVVCHAARPTAANHSPDHGSKVVSLSAGKRGPPRTPLQTAAAPSSVGASFVQRYAEARRLIEGGVIDPTLEALARAVKVSQRPAQRFLKALCAEGVIEWNGRRYRRRASVLAA